MSTGGALARRYARALLELAGEQQQIDQVRHELEELSATWAGSHELQELFENPKFPAAVRKDVLKEVLERSGVSQLTKNAMLYLCDHQRVAALPHIAQAYAELAEHSAGTVRAQVTSAAKLPDGYLAQLQQALEQATGKKVAIEHKLDPSLIAGVVTRVGDQVFDGSVRTRLAGLKESLTSA